MVKKSPKMLPKWPPGAPRRGLGTYLGRPREKDLNFESILGALGLPGGSLGEPCGDPFWPLDPSRGAPEGLGEPILRHLGRLPFSTLIPDPKNRQKSSISRVPEPRKLHWRLDGSAIFTFSLISRPNPKIVDLGSSFGSILGAFWLIIAVQGRPKVEN